MFWRSRKSPVCRALKALLAVQDAWITWEFDDDRWTETVVVVFEYDTDPAGSSFRAEFLEQVRETVRADNPAVHRRIRVIPRSAAAN